MAFALIFCKESIAELRQTYDEDSSSEFRLAAAADDVLPAESREMRRGDTPNRWSHDADSATMRVTWQTIDPPEFALNYIESGLAVRCRCMRFGSARLLFVPEGVDPIVKPSENGCEYVSPIIGIICVFSGCRCVWGWVEVLTGVVVIRVAIPSTFP